MAESAPSVGPLRYLSSAELDGCLPSVDERLDLAQRALVALAAGDAEMPPKIGVHPREGALLHAMPAWLRSDDLVGLKWVSAYPGNKRHGLAAINGLVVLNDAETGLPLWLLDAARITAVRTAAVSGVAMRLFAPVEVRRVALLGAGVQARSHLEVIEALLPQATVALHDRHPERVAALAQEANAGRVGDWVRPAPSPAEAVANAQVVVTVATLGARADRLSIGDVAPGALVVAVDFATYVAPDLAHGARLFAVDDRDQFLHYRELGYFDGYPGPAATLGELADDDRRGQVVGQDDERPIVVTHLGVGLADVVFADAICRRAEQSGAGTRLDR